MPGDEWLATRSSQCQAAAALLAENAPWIAGGLPSAAPAHVDPGPRTMRRQHLDAEVSQIERPEVWADWKGGTEGSATPLADRWFQSKTDPWTEAQPWCRPESQMRGREAWTGWPQSTWDARNDEALPPNQWDPNGWPRASWLPPRVEVAGWSRPPPNAWSGWCGWSSQWLKPPDRKDVKGPEI